MTLYCIIIHAFFVVVSPDIDETYLYQVENQSSY